MAFLARSHPARFAFLNASGLMTLLCVHLKLLSKHQQAVKKMTKRARRAD